ncbi:cytochrome c oxidase subunit 2A [Bacillus testis]|nr:cytochrome c oxidase subunit 2A [Bacillus testis]
MAQTQLKKKPEAHTDEHSSLKGTLASVFIVGLVILVTWVSVYFLFVNRL